MVFLDTDADEVNAKLDAMLANADFLRLAELTNAKLLETDAKAVFLTLNAETTLKLAAMDSVFCVPSTND